MCSAFFPLVTGRLGPLARRWLTGLLAAGSLAAGPVQAHGPAAGVSVPAPIMLQVPGPLAPPPPGVAELRFQEFFQQPVGPRGLQASARLLALDGQRVRLVGYMVREAQAPAGRLILTAMPVLLGDEDEPLADDLPPAALFVHLAGAASQARLPHVSGLIQLQGRLQVGPLAEPDGHVSTVRLLLDDAASAPLAMLAAVSGPAVPAAR